MVKSIKLIGYWAYDKCYQLYLLCGKDYKKLKIHNENYIKAIKRYSYCF